MVPRTFASFTSIIVRKWLDREDEGGLSKASALPRAKLRQGVLGGERGNLAFETDVFLFRPFFQLRERESLPGFFHRLHELEGRKTQKIPMQNHGVILSTLVIS